MHQTGFGGGPGGFGEPLNTGPSGLNGRFFGLGEVYGVTAPRRIKRAVYTSKGQQLSRDVSPLEQQSTGYEYAAVGQEGESYGA